MVAGDLGIGGVGVTANGCGFFGKVMTMFQNQIVVMPVQLSE